MLIPRTLPYSYACFLPFSAPNSLLAHFQPKKKSKTSSASDAPSSSTIAKLSHTLSLPEAEVSAMIASRGASGPPSTSSRRGRKDPAEEEKEQSTGVKDCGAWADFMDDEGAEVGVSNIDSAPPPAAASNSAGDGSYIPVASDYDESGALSGFVVQAGTLDWPTVGRTRRAASDTHPLDLASPHALVPSLFGAVRVRMVATSCTSCHCFAVSTEGALYGWGRNEVRG